MGPGGMAMMLGLLRDNPKLAGMMMQMHGEMMRIRGEELTKMGDMMRRYGESLEKESSKIKLRTWFGYRKSEVLNTAACVYMALTAL